MEPLPLGLDSLPDAAAVRPREPAGVAGDLAAGSVTAAELGARTPEGIDWTKPPYTVGGLVRLVLEGEDPDSIPRAEMDRRLGERQRQIFASARSLWDLDVTDYRRAACAVFGVLELPPPSVSGRVDRSAAYIAL